jgi:hypothetical protein
MRRLLCRLLGHDRLASGGAHRTCLRCGMQEKLRNFDDVRGWEDVTRFARRGSRA